jgi:hypothetical protein
MSLDFVSGSSGGGKPLQKPVQKSPNVEESQQRFETVDNVKSSSAAALAATDSADEVKQQQKLVSQRSSPLTDSDIMELLFKLQQSPSQDNKQILSTLIQYGLPASEEGMNTIRTLMKGAKSGHAIESAVVSYSKGIKNGKSVDLVSRFLSQQLGVTNSLSNLQISLSQFSSMVDASKSLFNVGLFTGLNAVLAEMVSEIKKLNQKSDDDQFAFSVLDRGQLLKDSKTLLGFLIGLDQRVEKQSKDVAKIDTFRQSSSRLQSDLSSLIDALLGQLVLTKEGLTTLTHSDDFAYWQLPNPLAQTLSHVDLLIKREKKGDKFQLDEKKTRIILYFETPHLGKVSVIIDLLKNKLSYIFQTDQGRTKEYVAEMSAELKDRMETLNYDLVGLKTEYKQFKTDLKDLLLPIIDLNKVNRIITEA